MSLPPFNGPEIDRQAPSDSDSHSEAPPQYDGLAPPTPRRIPTWATPFCSSASPVCSCWFFKSSCWFWARRLRRRMPASSPCRTPDCSSPWKPQPIWSPCWPPGSSFPCSGNAAFSTECAGIGQRRAARRQSSSPLACCWRSNAAGHVLHYPAQDATIDEFFLTSSSAWVTTFFGILVAPVFEEICFRGFLLPAFAIAYDWLSLPRTPEARLRWHTTATLTPISLIFSAVLTSILFAAMHAEQIAHIWAALLALFTISLLLTYVRVKTQSVAASAMVHAAYNGLVFLTVLIFTGGYRHLDRMTH